MNCPKCGASANRDDLFCGLCGATLLKESNQSSSRTCPHCQSPVFPEDNFCGNCGTVLPEQLKETINICPKCKTPYFPGDVFCGVCGAEIEFSFDSTPESTGVESPFIQAPEPQAQPIPKPPASHPQTSQSYQSGPSSFYRKSPTSEVSASKIILVTFTLVILICVVAVGGYFAFKWYEKNSFEKRIETALANNAIFSPPNECVADIISSEKLKDPNSKKIDEYAPKIMAVVKPPLEKALESWYKDSDISIGWEEMEKQYGFLTSLFPDDKDIMAKYLYCGGQKEINAKNFEQARDLYLKALDAKPGWVLPLNGLGKVYIRDDSPLKDLSKSLDYYRQAADADPNFTWAFVNLAIYYKNNGDLETARTYMQKAVDTNPTKASVYSLMGAICYKMANLNDAEKYFRKALEFETDGNKRANLEKAIANINQTKASGENVNPDSQDNQ